MSKEKYVAKFVTYQLEVTTHNLDRLRKIADYIWWDTKDSVLQSSTHIYEITVENGKVIGRKEVPLT